MNEAGRDLGLVAGGKDYAGKPRPPVIAQDDSFDATEPITVCAFTTDPAEAPLFRLPVEPNERNGLRSPCSLMVDKISTVTRPKLGTHIGRLDDADILCLVFLGLASLASSARITTTRRLVGVWKVLRGECQSCAAPEHRESIGHA